MARGDQLARTWQIIKRLERQRGRGLTVEELCEEGDWNKRTLYRDINALIDAGFPIEKENCDGRVYYRFTKDFRESLPPTFNLTEIVALSLSQDLMKVLKGTFFYESIESALSKIKAILPAKAISYLGQIEGSLHAGMFPKANLEDFGKTLDILYDAVIAKRVCKIRYHSATSNRKSERQIEPYKVWFTNGSVYLVAFDRESNEQRTFSLTRIESCEVSEGESFSHSDFDFEAYRKGSLRVWRGEPEQINLRFSQTVAPIIEENVWHESQKTKKGSNGDIELAMNVAVTPELEGWILGWGSHVTVLAPASLKNSILKSARTIIDLYEGEKPEPILKPFSSKS
jgi:predicted DNA-binding transcriptional regulator YafY